MDKVVVGYSFQIPRNTPRKLFVKSTPLLSPALARAYANNSFARFRRISLHVLCYCVAARNCVGTLLRSWQILPESSFPF